MGCVDDCLGLCCKWTFLFDVLRHAVWVCLILFQSSLMFTPLLLSFNNALALYTFLLCAFVPYPELQLTHG